MALAMVATSEALRAMAISDVVCGAGAIATGVCVSGTSCSMSVDPASAPAES